MSEDSILSFALIAIGAIILGLSLGYIGNRRDDLAASNNMRSPGQAHGHINALNELDGFKGESGEREAVEEVHTLVSNMIKFI